MDNKLLALAFSHRIKILNIENLEKSHFIIHNQDQVMNNFKLQSDGNKLISLCFLKLRCNQYIIARDFNSGNKLGEIQVGIRTVIGDFKVSWPYIICVRYTKEKDEGIRILNMEKENVLKDILWKSPIGPRGIEIKSKFLIVKEVHKDNTENTYSTRFLNYEDLFGDMMSSIEDLSSRQVEELHFHKNIMAGNSVLTIFKSYLLKRSYWISKSKTDIYKSKNDISDADEGTDRKKRKIN